GDIEQRYRRYCARRDRRYVRTLLNILIVLYVCYGASDWFLLQDEVAPVWIVRFGFGLPGLVLLWILTRFHAVEPHIEKLVVAGLVWLSVTTLVMARLVAADVMALYLSSVLAIIMAGLTITHLRFWYAVVTGVVFLVAQVAIVLPIEDNPRYLLYYFFLS